MLKVKDIESVYTQSILEGLGFQKTTTYRFNQKVVEYSWFDGKKRYKNEAPSVVIDVNTGELLMHCGGSYVLKNIPDIVYVLFQNDLIDVSTISDSNDEQLKN